MSTPRLSLPRPSRDASWGLRVGIILAVVALAAALFLLPRGGAREDGRAEEPPLTAAALDSYLGIVREVRLGRREAREAGQPPAAWSEHPRIRAALEGIGWTMRDYQLVEGQVAAARLAITDPGLMFDSDDPNSRPVPEEHVALVRARLPEVRAAQAPLP